MRWVKPYPEVTGYILSLFSSRRIHEDLCSQMAHRLMRLQRPYGGYFSFKKKAAYVFDTAQIGKGLVDWYMWSKDEAAKKAVRLCGDFIRKMQLDSGAFFPIYSERSRERVSLNTSWGTSFSTINCKATEFLIALQEAHVDDFREVINKICQWTLRQEQLLYTHPGAYSLEGLWAGGFAKEVGERLEKCFIPRIQENGFLAYHPDLQYSYSSGSVQVGILCALNGFLDEAKSIWQWAWNVQQKHNNGGLFQYANPDGSINTSIHSEINSWGTKYFYEFSSILQTKTADLY